MKETPFFPTPSETNSFQDFSPEQTRVVEAVAFSVLSGKIGYQKYRAYPLTLNQGVVQDMYLAFVRNDDSPNGLVQTLVRHYQEQEDARYRGWLKEILGERIEEHLIGDVAPYKFYVDMERARAEGRGLRW